MQNEMWKMFKLTGSIDSYLYYKSIVNGELANDMKNLMTEESEELTPQIEE